MKSLIKIFKICIVLIILSVLSIWVADILVCKKTESKIYNSIDKIPHNKVGLLLGTAKFLSTGSINLYYKYRIDAAVTLYKSGKIEYILVSGDNSKKNYDKPSTIKTDLIAQGVPEDKIYLDYAGFRTLDSVIRCKEIFGQESITIITQKFHNERAIYIASNKNIKAVGFNANDVTLKYGFKTRLRERFARVKMIIDLTMNKKSKFLGEKIIID